MMGVRPAETYVGYVAQINLRIYVSDVAYLLLHNFFPVHTHTAASGHWAV